MSALFVAVLLASLGLKLWLYARQARYVAAHRGTVPAAFSDAISLSAHQRAADYNCARLQLAAIEATVGAGLVYALTLGGGLQALYDFSARWLEAGSVAQGCAFLASVMLVGALVDLPFSIWRSFRIEARFGFNRMSPALFVADLAREALVAVLIGLPALAAVLWLMMAMGEHWWLWVWLFWLGFNLLMLMIWPTLIAPLFNRFTPLQDETLRARVEALLARCGFRSKGLFVMDGSRRSAHGNAYFTGFGAAKRIVFYDTLLDKLSADEVEAVLAHELGHFHHRHILQRLLLMALGSLGFLALLGQLMQSPQFFATFGLSATGAAPALALFMLVLPVLLFPLTPLMSGWSRRHEYQADAYAARHARASDLINALVKLYRDNAATLTPDPLYSRFHDSHPPAALRIARLQAQHD